MIENWKGLGEMESLTLDISTLCRGGYNVVEDDVTSVVEVGSLSWCLLSFELDPRSFSTLSLPGEAHIRTSTTAKPSTLELTEEKV